MPDIKEKMITAVDCAILRLKGNMNKKFFIAYTLTNLYRNQIQKYETGSTRKRISRKNLGLVRVPVPDIQQQNTYAAFVDKSISAIASTEKMITNIKNIQKAIISNLLTEVSSHV
jgi:type I restriction enzyme S subunit